MREIEQLVRRLQRPEKEQKKTGDQTEIADFERQLYSKLGGNVTVKHTRSGKGRVLINYANIAELEALIKRIK